MTGWMEFALALTVFFASHFLPSLGGLRDRVIARTGRRVYFAGYGIVSLVVLGWLILAAARAPHVELWPQTEAARWVPNLVMPLALILTVAGIGSAWPWTLGGRRTPFDPARPGLAAVTRHPLAIALILWSATHLAPNGDLAHVILFGSFLVLSLAAIPVFDRRARHAMAPDAAGAAFAATALLSLRPLADPPWLRQNGRALVTRIVLALSLWALLLVLHGPVIGVTPLPS